MTTGLHLGLIRGTTPSIIPIATIAPILGVGAGAGAGAILLLGTMATRGGMKMASGTATTGDHTTIITMTPIVVAPTAHPTAMGMDEEIANTMGVATTSRAMGWGETPRLADARVPPHQGLNKPLTREIATQGEATGLRKVAIVV